MWCCCRLKQHLADFTQPITSQLNPQPAPAPPPQPPINIDIYVEDVDSGCWFNVDCQEETSFNDGGVIDHSPASSQSTVAPLAMEEPDERPMDSAELLSAIRQFEQNFSSVNWAEIMKGAGGSEGADNTLEIMQSIRARKCSLLQVPEPHLDEKIEETSASAPASPGLQGLMERLPSRLPPKTTIVEDGPSEPPPTYTLQQRRTATAGLLAKNTASPSPHPRRRTSQGATAEEVSNVSVPLAQGEMFRDDEDDFDGELPDESLALADIQSRSYLYRDCDTDYLTYDGKKHKISLPWMNFKNKKIVDATFLGVLDRLKVFPVDHHLIHLRDKQWWEAVEDIHPISSADEESPPVRSDERKRRDVVWELFTAELNYLIDHLMVMCMVFLEPLKEVQCEGFLLDMEPVKIFANLEDVCKVTSIFCSEMHHHIFRSSSFGSAQGIARVFSKFETQVCPSYQRYCMNYSNALGYLDSLRDNEHWSVFVSHCEKDPRCKRLKLTDLLVAPMQHLTKYPLLIKTIRKKTTDHRERKLLQDAIHNVEKAIQSVEGQVKWLKNFERLQELSKQIQWVSVLDQEGRPNLPEQSWRMCYQRLALRQKIIEGSMERIIASPLRNLRYEGQLTMSENSKNIRCYIFLFDDMLLVTKMLKKKGSSFDDYGSTDGSLTGIARRRSSHNSREEPQFVVCRQPIPLDRLEVHPIDKKSESGCGLKNAFLLIHVSRFQQIIAMCLLQASDESLKIAWLKQLREAKMNWETILHHKYSSRTQEDISEPSGAKTNSQAISNSNS